MTKHFRASRFCLETWLVCTPDHGFGEQPVSILALNIKKSRKKRDAYRVLCFPFSILGYITILSPYNHHMMIIFLFFGFDPRPWQVLVRVHFGMWPYPSWTQGRHAPCPLALSLWRSSVTFGIQNAKSQHYTRQLSEEYFIVVKCVIYIYIYLYT